MKLSNLLSTDETPDNKKEYVTITVMGSGNIPLDPVSIEKKEYFNLLAKTALDLHGKKHYEAFCNLTGIPVRGRIYRTLTRSLTVEDVIVLAALGYVAVKVGGWIANTDLVRGVERAEQHELVGVQAAPAAVPAPQSMSFVA
jgi:hypothetical protein